MELDEIQITLDNFSTYIKECGVELIKDFTIRTIEGIRNKIHEGYSTLELLDYIDRLLNQLD